MNVRKHQVLLVEDEQHLADMAILALEDAGYHVVSAAEVAEAVELIRTQLCDAAVLNIRMGNELVFEVASVLFEHNIPFAFVASQSLDPLPDEHVHRPRLQKPYRLHQLTQIVHALLDDPTYRGESRFRS